MTNEELIPIIKDIVEKAVQNDDLMTDFLPIIGTLAGAAAVGLITYFLNKQKIESEQKLETIKNKRNHLLNISNCFTDFENQTTNLAIKMDIAAGPNATNLTDEDIENTKNQYLIAQENMVHARGIIRILNVENLEALLNTYALTATNIIEIEHKNLETKEAIEERSKLLREMKRISKETFKLLSKNYK